MTTMPTEQEVRAALERLKNEIYVSGPYAGTVAVFAADLAALLASHAHLSAENAKFRELVNDDWFHETAEFLDDYTDAEIIDGTTHPNKALRLLSKLQELGL